MYFDRILNTYKKEDFMFKLIRDNRNISTKNLYIGELATFHKNSILL